MTPLLGMCETHMASMKNSSLPNASPNVCNWGENNITEQNWLSRKPDYCSVHTPVMVKQNREK